MKKLGYLALFFFVIVATAEIFSRLAGFGHPLVYKSSVAGYELLPNQSVTRLGKSTHINALGTRGPEVSPLPAPSTYRIMVLGDSVANGGAQVNDDQTWPLLLQAAYVRSGRAVEVINASAGGWATGNESAWLAEHGTLGSRLIILEINEKDLDQQFVGPEILDANVSFPSKLPRFALSEIYSRYLIPRLGLGASSSDPGSTSGAFQAKNTATELNDVERIIRLSTRSGAKVIIFYWDISNTKNIDVNNCRERLFQLAKNNNVVVVRPNISENIYKKKYFRDLVHPNVAGNEFISSYLFKEIRL